jgi:hypothetical protein
MAIASIDWSETRHSLDEQGWAVLPRLLGPDDCRNAARSWDEEERFRSRVVMARHGFGQGEYRYFDYPLPGPVAALRTSLYPPLAEAANRWQSALGRSGRFPASHEDYLARCRAAGQSRPTPLLLRYGPGDYNCLHQDLYGAEAFPLQAAILLSRPGEDFAGGEFLLAEQRPRRQSRASVVPLGQGDAVVFAVSERPVEGSPRRLPHPDEAWRQHDPLRRALHPRPDLPRRGVICLRTASRRGGRLSRQLDERHRCARLEDDRAAAIGLEQLAVEQDVGACALDPDLVAALEMDSGEALAPQPPAHRGDEGAEQRADIAVDDQQLHRSGAGADAGHIALEQQPLQGRHHQEGEAAVELAALHPGHAQRRRRRRQEARPPAEHHPEQPEQQRQHMGEPLGRPSG